jgi:hypothetical protein
MRLQRIKGEILARSYLLNNDTGDFEYAWWARQRQRGCASFGQAAAGDAIDVIL